VTGDSNTAAPFYPLRASAPRHPTHQPLGPLAELPGTWVGGGFNLVSLPDKANNQIFRVKLNATHESLSFAKIGAPVPNRGFLQGDIMLFGLHYLQQVSDATSHEALHLEPGLWLNVPATSAPPVHHHTIVRQSTIPHGDSLLAQSTFVKTVKSGPDIEPVSSLPTGPGLKDKPFGYTEKLTLAQPPAGIPKAAVLNPNLVLSQTLAAQAKAGLKITETTIIAVSTTPVGGIVNIPFITANANATRMEAIFWIETVQQPDGSAFLQLQYTQTVILNFDDIDWPHISVATLIKQ
jgi:hypothetical protein